MLRELCYDKNIPYISLDYPRYEFHKLYSHNLGLRFSNLFEEKYNFYYHADIEIIKDSLEYVDEFRNKATIMHAMYANDVTSQYKPDSFLKVLKILLGKVNYFREQDAIGNNKAIKKSNLLLYPSSKEYIKFYFNYKMLRLKTLTF